jgi:hypothetical protein
VVGRAHVSSAKALPSVNANKDSRGPVANTSVPDGHQSTHAQVVVHVSLLERRRTSQPSVCAKLVLAGAPVSSLVHLEKVTPSLALGMVSVLHRRQG